jgi:hypothetical protein
LIAKVINFGRPLLNSRQLPLFLALLAAISMLPALKVGLFGDDLIQRPTQLKAADLPAHLVDTGLVPPDSGELSTVVLQLFNYLGRPNAISAARDYGIVPWWIPPSWGAALWRPLTASTHWVDYRLFPNAPALMHAHNILWYAAAVFLAAICYRRISESLAIPSAAARQTAATSPQKQSTLADSAFAAGLAALLFLLDKDNYGPVAYVANRGFIIALVFSLGCLYAHHRWRTMDSKIFMLLSALCLLLSLFANEGGASTLAFLLAYALVIERGRWRSRVASLIPAAVVMLLWRTAYTGGGFGVRSFVGYIDPGYTPLAFLKNLVPRMNGLLGGQLTGIPPEINFGLSPQMRIVLAMLFAGFSLVCAVVFLPVLRRSVLARFWGTVMLLALVPAATVVPLSKNLGFVAIGVFGLIAAFLCHFAAREHRAALPLSLRTLSWAIASWLLLAHVVGAVAARIGLAAISPHIPDAWEQLCAFRATEIGDRDVIIVNDPAETPIVVPFDRAYRGQPLPNSIRTLAPGLSGLTISRPDASTLVLTSKGQDLFECPPLGPFHVGYALKSANDFLFGGRVWCVGDRIISKRFVAQVLELSPEGIPRSIAFHFEQSLDSDNMVWLYLDWQRHAHLPFALPAIGGTAELRGPTGWRGRPRPDKSGQAHSGFPI